MDFNLKNYKRFKIKYYLKTVNFFFFFHGTSLNNENWIKIEQSFVINKLKYIRVLNKIMINILKNSILKNLVVLIHGPILLLSINKNKSKLTFKKLENISPLINFLGFKLNNKIYSKEQVRNLKKMSYFENVYIFHNSMKTFTKMPYYKFKTKKTVLLSK